MIISASRRTDIPACYSDWFFNRIREGFVLARNPMNARQIGRICLSPDVVDGIVFWTKNPAPMLGRLSELSDYAYCFQFTLTPYGKDVEPNIPDKAEAVIPAFQRLSSEIGARRVVWRYDPILLSPKYGIDYHVRAFEKIAGRLKGYTNKVVVSFIKADYRNVKSNAAALGLLGLSRETQIELLRRLAEIARSCGLLIDTCAERLGLAEYGVGRARCIDRQLFEELLGDSLRIEKDAAQRPECGCAASIDIGAYNTCRNGCRYCYANYSQGLVRANGQKHDPLSPLLPGGVEAGDKITERPVKSNRERQLRLMTNDK
jgi:hypothetical protein